MVRFPSNSSKKSLKQRLDFPDNKGLQLWSDLLKFEAEQSLKERLVFLEKMDCNYGQISLKFMLKNHSNNVRFPLNLKQKIIDQRLDFSNKKELQLWLDFLQFQAEKCLKQRLVFSKKNGLQLSSDFLQMQAKNIETMLGFLR